MASKQQLISVVVPCYNEQESIQFTHTRFMEVFAKADFDVELVYINDGSKDDTLRILKEDIASQKTERIRTIKIVELSRNFGHQLAVSAGLTCVNGDAIVIIDADLQDPPEVIFEMVAEWRAGYKIVYGQRNERKGESWFKLYTAKKFYQIIDYMSEINIPRNTGDFRLVDTVVVDLMNKMPEQDRFLRGMFAWMGYKSKAVMYNRDARIAGESKYPFKKMLKLAIDGILSFSIKPLKLIRVLGFIFMLAALAIVAYAVYIRLYTDVWVSGWTFLTILICVSNSLIMLSISVIGDYVGRIFIQSKNRPLFIIDEVFEANKNIEG